MHAYQILAGGYSVHILHYGWIPIIMYGLRLNCYLDSVEILIPLIGE